MRSSLPLFESILVFENYPDDSSIGQFSDLTIDLHNVFSKGSQTKYALTLMVIPSSTLEFKLVYDSYRLASLDITLILEHFLALLNSMVAVPDQQIKTLLGTIHSDHIPKVKSLQKRNQQELEETFLAPRDALELQLTQIWQDVLKVHSVGIRDNFFELGGHFLVAITLMERIQQKFGKNLPLATLFQGATIEHLASILRQQTDSPSWSTLVAIQPEGPKRPLFCVHAGATTVLAYIDLASYLGSEQPFYALESLGLDEEQKPYARIEDMAAHYIAAIQSVQPQGPYRLAGWCFGGLVAFEMAQQLPARGEQVSFLGLLDASTGLNVLFEEYQELDDAAFLVKLVAEEVSLSLDRIRQLGPDEQLLYVIEQARQLNLIPPDLELAQAQRLVQMLKSHIYAGKIYIPQPYRGRVTLFRASEEAAADSPDLTLGWQELATEGVDIHWVPGNHLTMVREPHVQVLAKQLRACLEQSQAND